MSSPPLANYPSSSCGTEIPSDTFTASQVTSVAAGGSEGSGPGSPAPSKPEESIPRSNVYWTSKAEEARSIFQKTMTPATVAFNFSRAMQERIREESRTYTDSLMQRLPNAQFRDWVDDQREMAQRFFECGRNYLESGKASLEKIASEAQEIVPEETPEASRARTDCYECATRLGNKLSRTMADVSAHVGNAQLLGRNEGSA